jgi:hypothetical protein
MLCSTGGPGRGLVAKGAGRAGGAAISSREAYSQHMPNSSHDTVSCSHVE